MNSINGVTKNQSTNKNAIVSKENPSDIIVSVEFGEKRREMSSATTNPEAATVAEIRFPLNVTKRPPQKAPPR